MTSALRFLVLVLLVVSCKTANSNLSEDQLGVNDGNGGHQFVCKKDFPKAGIVEGVPISLDLYEAQQRSAPTPVALKGSTYLEKAGNILTSISKLDPDRYALYQLYLKDFLKESEISDQYLVPNSPGFGDAGLVKYPEGAQEGDCDIKVVVYQRPPELMQDYGKHYYIKKSLWDNLSDDSKAALVVHEIVYREVRGMKERRTTSRLIRHYVGSMMSGTFKSFNAEGYAFDIDHEMHLLPIKMVTIKAAKAGGRDRVYFMDLRTWKDLGNGLFQVNSLEDESYQGKFLSYLQTYHPIFNGARPWEERTEECFFSDGREEYLDNCDFVTNKGTVTVTPKRRFRSEHNAITMVYNEKTSKIHSLSTNSSWAISMKLSNGAVVKYIELVDFANNFLGGSFIEVKPSAIIPKYTENQPVNFSRIEFGKNGEVKVTLGKRSDGVLYFKNPQFLKVGPGDSVTVDANGKVIGTATNY